MNDGVLVSRAWLEKVNAALFGASELPEGTTAETSSRFFDVRPVQIRTNGGWVYDGSEWKAQASFVINNAIVTSFTFDLYAPAYVGSSNRPPQGTGRRLYAVWRGRWEAVQDPIVVPTYGGGSYISVTMNTGSGGADYLINNEGLTRGIIKDSGGDANPLLGELWFDGGNFKRATFEGTTKKGVGIRSHSQTVVTAVTLTNGNLDVTTKTVEVLGES